jgi:hypothetical protein
MKHEELAGVEHGGRFRNRDGVAHHDVPHRPIRRVQQQAPRRHDPLQAVLLVDDVEVNDPPLRRLLPEGRQRFGDRLVFVQSGEVGPHVLHDGIVQPMFDGWCLCHQMYAPNLPVTARQASGVCRQSPAETVSARTREAPRNSARRPNRDRRA